ncbi:MAG: glycoside hydrolase [Acidobacteria bacterium]|nr:MAG: glycoside hydrolase [Acidobacteriota bacterium]
MEVALSTVGKFHTFDLARQLYDRQCLKTIFSGYPRWKLRDEGLPREKVDTFPWLHAPYMRFAAHRSPALKRLWEWYDRVLFDQHVAHNLPKCDVFCGLSGSVLRSGLKAHAMGARFVCDRGSAHIRVQDQILREEHELNRSSFRGIDPRIIQREEAEYELADAITVPSTFALNSFLLMGIPRRKLKLVPYGVDLRRFHKTTDPDKSEFNVLFVGGLSLQKGLVYLLQAFDKLQHRRKTLTIAGSSTTDSIPLLDKFATREDVHILGHVPQPLLKNIMSASHVMVLPSVQEGLAMVQAQALACGCPVIASANTGANDLFSDSVEGYIVPIRNADAIADRMQVLADNPGVREQMSSAALRRVKSIGGWDQYGETMLRVFSELAAEL